MSGLHHLGSGAARCPPEFTLFSDGHVIIKRNGKLVEGNLAPEAYADLIEEMKSSGVLGLPSCFTGGVIVLHTLETTLLVAKGARYKRVRIEGFRGGESVNVPMKRELPPEAFLKVYCRLMSLPIPDAKPSGFFDHSNGRNGRFVAQRHQGTCVAAPLYFAYLRRHVVCCSIVV